LIVIEGLIIILAIAFVMAILFAEKNINE